MKKETIKQIKGMAVFIFISLICVSITTLIGLDTISSVENRLEFEKDLIDNCKRIGYDNYIVDAKFLGTTKYYCIKQDEGILVDKKEISNMEEFLQIHNEVNLLNIYFREDSE